MKVHEYKGKGITITYDVRRCIHAKECVYGAPSVFNPANKLWVSPDCGSPERIAEVIVRCPTGALHYQPADTSLAELPEPSNTVRVRPDGPLYVRGHVVIATQAGEPVASETRVALCRCGVSKNKPFCDNSHLAVAFKDPAMTIPGAKALNEMVTS